MKQRKRADKQGESLNGTPLPEGFDEHGFASALERWFRDHGRRDLPWRMTRDPYAILVSELMLQQTQVATVVRGRYFERWLDEFPDWQTLAEAEEDRVLKAWEGLGYYRRARTLHALAGCVVGKLGGQLPESVGQLEQLPGIGPYTAGAVASLAFGRRRAAVDGNVARILARVADRRAPIDTSEGVRWTRETAQAMVKCCDDPRQFNAALMELGQRICVPGRPRCHECPVRDFCVCGLGQGSDPAELPRKKSATRPTEVHENVLLWRRGGRVLLQRIGAGRRRAGLWQLPEASRVDAGRQALLGLTYAITRYRVRLTVSAPSEGELPPDGEGYRWVDEHELAEIAMAAPYRKALVKLTADL